MFGPIMDAVFATPRAARRAAARQSLAMEMPQISRVATATGRQVKDFDGKIKPQEWQAEAYGHADQIGELGYVLTLLAANVAKGKLVVVERDEHGQVVEPEKDEQGRDIIQGDREKAERVLQAFRGPEGDHRAMLAAGAIHDQIAGEGLLLGEPIPDTNGISWELVSVLEVVQDQRAEVLTRKRSAKSGTVSIADPTAAAQPLDPDTYLARYHRADWSHSGDATSALRRNAAVCREVILWTQLIESTIKSRLAAGLLLVPEEITFGTDDEGMEDVDDADRFIELLVEHMSAPVTDRKSAAAIAPMVVRCASDLIDKWKLLSLTDGSLDLMGMLDARSNALRRLAAGLDVPLEVMTGMGSTSHWSAANIDQSTVDKHVIPIGERLARFFSTSMFRRLLIAAEEMDEATSERWALEFDGSEIATRSDVATSADLLHREGLISDDARVEAHGFDPNEVRPSDEERSRRIVEKLAVVPDKGNLPMLPAIGVDLEAMGLDPEVVDKLFSPPKPAPMFQPAQPEDPPEDQPEDVPPEPIGGPEIPAAGEPDGEAMRIVLERVRTAASMAVDRALERSANQVVTAARRLPAETRAKVDSPNYRSGSRKVEVLRLLSATDWRAVQRSPEALIRGAFTDFEQQAVDWLREAFEATREPLTADEDARRAASLLCAQLDALALSAFRQPLQRERGLSVPMALVLDAVGVGARR